MGIEKTIVNQSCQPDLLTMMMFHHGIKIKLILGSFVILMLNIHQSSSWIGHIRLLSAVD